MKATLRAATLGLAVAALVAECLRWWVALHAEERHAQARRRAYEAGVSVGRELQRAMHAGEAPFPPTELGDDFPRYGVEAPFPDRMQWGAPSSTHFRPPGDDHR